MAEREKAAQKPKDATPRFGIGEWFGNRSTELTVAKRQHLGAEKLKKKRDRDPQPCPFKTSQGTACTKPGGVCSLRLYSYCQH